MLSFTSDYIAGAHPKVLEKLVETNLENLSGYGTDIYSEEAKEKIKKACGNENAQVFFLSGGTQANEVVISTMLKPYECVLAAETGHINGHEAGAVEYTGYRIIALPQEQGKIKAETVRKYLRDFYANENHEHMTFPGMVYISFPTEYGTLYSKKELTDLYEVCKEEKLILFIDGARLGYGLMSEECDLTLPELNRLCDVFYIGGTKVGALLGEAVVFTHQNAPEHFITMTKQRGAMLAKGRVTGVQFNALFTDNLYFEISAHAIRLAKNLRELFHRKGYTFFLESPTNQQFILIENQKMKELSKKVQFSFWEKADENHTVIRFVTSWSTKDEDLTELEKVL